MVGYVFSDLVPIANEQLDRARGIGAVPGLIDAITALLLASYDAITAATPLDLFRQNEGMMFSDLMSASEMMGTIAGVGWDWVNLLFAAESGCTTTHYSGRPSWHARCTGAVCRFGFDDGSSTVAAPCCSICFRVQLRRRVFHHYRSSEFGGLQPRTLDIRCAGGRIVS